MTDDRMAYLAQCQRESAALVAPEYRPAALPDHGSEIRVAHGSVPSPEAAVNMGVTPSSGEGHGPWPRRPI
jgi:hypothetical protein